MLDKFEQDIVSSMILGKVISSEENLLSPTFCRNILAFETSTNTIYDGEKVWFNDKHGKSWVLWLEHLKIHDRYGRVWKADGCF